MIAAGNSSSVGATGVVFFLVGRCGVDPTSLSCQSPPSSVSSCDHTSPRMIAGEVMYTTDPFLTLAVHNI